MAVFLNLLTKSGCPVTISKKRMANVGSQLIRPILRQLVLSIVEVSAPDNNPYCQKC